MANCAPAIYWLLPPLGDVDCIGGFCRYIATDGSWYCLSRQQGIYLIRDMPGMLNKLSDFAATLPRRYPALMDAGIIDAMAENMRSRMLTMGDSVVKISLASLVGLLTIAVYLVLVPLMVFFLLKDKEQMLNAVRRVLPRNRGLAGQVWKEMNQQITNYIRGKVLEMIVVGIATGWGSCSLG